MVFHQIVFLAKSFVCVLYSEHRRLHFLEFLVMVSGPCEDVSHKIYPFKITLYEIRGSYSESR